MEFRGSMPNEDTLKEMKQVLGTECFVNVFFFTFVVGVGVGVSVLNANNLWNDQISRINVCILQVQIKYYIWSARLY